MNGFTAGTGQTQSFSELAFAFKITPGIVMVGLSFAVLMGSRGWTAAGAAGVADADHEGVARGVRSQCQLSAKRRRGFHRAVYYCDSCCSSSRD